MDFFEKISPSPNPNMNRRSFLKLGVFFAGLNILPYKAFAAIDKLFSPERSLSLYNPNTGENLDTTFWRNGEYLPESLGRINYILRDHYSDEVKVIDTHLIDLLYALRVRLETSRPFHVVSGYRSRSTNELLRRSRRGVAKNSLHIYGKATDISLEGVSLSSLRKAAMQIRGGGVGYYPSRNFVHIDIGEVRSW